MPVILPPELHIEIVQWLGQPVHRPSSFERSQVNVKALSNLCLVNHAFNHVTTPILYELVYLTPTNLRAFSTSLCMSPKRCSEVTSLAITEFPETFAADQTGYRLTDNLILVFRALAFSLKRLLLDVPFHMTIRTSIGQLLSDAVWDLRAIEEAVIVQDELRPPDYFVRERFGYWPTIKRLATYNIPVERIDIMGLPSIERLCILNPDFGWAETDSIDELIQSAPTSFSQLLLLDYENYGSEWDEDDPYTPFTSDKMARELARKHPDVLKMVNIQESDETSAEMSVAEWFRSVAILGAVWDLERFALKGQDLAVYTAMSPEFMEMFQQFVAQQSSG